LAREQDVPDEPARSRENQAPPLTTGSRLRRLAGIGVLILGVFGAFLYLGGWLTPHALTPARFVDGFERVYGIHPGFRRNHAKGVCVSGFFSRATVRGRASRRRWSSELAECPSSAASRLVAQSLCRRCARFGPRPRTSVLATRWRGMADCYDQSPGIPSEDSARVFR
jgi:hypothetical protein